MLLLLNVVVVIGSAIIDKDFGDHRRVRVQNVAVQHRLADGEQALCVAALDHRVHISGDDLLITGNWPDLQCLQDG